MHDAILFSYYPDYVSAEKNKYLENFLGGNIREYLDDLAIVGNFLNKTESANHKESLIHLNTPKLKFLLIKGHYKESETISHKLGGNIFIYSA